MPSINLRQLRDTRQLKDWLDSGQVVELRERDRVLAQIVPQRTVRNAEWPDFEARAREIFGDRIIGAVDELVRMREEERY